ncbi:MAG: hypothetical protein B1H13_12250 [Desulfobacteraceae bacterium 4484_190.3]|nr:MAG: hypothetical protein B1H13_12250 [Desulfobacteraceae bacterium 4484_190.3]
MVTDEDRATLHKIVVEKYRRGQISIDVNRSSSLLLYPRISQNPLVKIFNFIVRVYSFPLTIIGVIFASVFTDNYLFVLCYIIGLFCLISAEDYLSEVTTINSVLTNQKVFSNLQRRGVIYVRDVVDPEIPV